MTLKLISTFQLLKSLQPANIINPGEMEINQYCLCQDGSGFRGADVWFHEPTVLSLGKTVIADKTVWNIKVIEVCSLGEIWARNE